MQSASGPSEVTRYDRQQEADKLDINEPSDTCDAADVVRRRVGRRISSVVAARAAALWAGTASLVPLTRLTTHRNDQDTKRHPCRNCTKTPPIRQRLRRCRM